MTKFYNIFLEEILTTIRKIKVMLEGKSFEDFSGNYHIVDDIMRYLKIIGEAAKHVPEDIKTENIPWNTIEELRDIVKQTVDLESVWYISKNLLAEVENELNKILKQNYEVS